MRLAEITLNPQNPRLIKDEKFARLKNSLKEFPQMMNLRPIVVDDQGVVLGGNMRLQALKSLGYKEVPDEWIKRAAELTEDEKKRFVISDNSSFGEWNWDLLANEWSDLPLSDWGVDIPEDWTGNGHKIEEDESAVAEMVDRAAELQEKWKTKLGQLWEIPSNSGQGKSHRLLVGDSTKKRDVAKLCADLVPSMIFCDPPYGVEIVSADSKVGGDKPFGKVRTIHKGMKVKPIIEANTYAPIIGDDTVKTAVSAYKLAASLFPKAVHIWWGGNYYADHLPASSCWIVWDKDNGDSFFADAELAWTNQKTAVRVFKHTWNGLIKETERGEKRVHPTQKPIALAEWCFEKYGSEGDVILDQFLGSGMSMLAAEKMGRTVYGLEMSEGYCAIALERLSALGLTPKLTG